jgi:DMSO/TMAO reductase YedYZ molybdopterin-dependent catalytic subunit
MSRIRRAIPGVDPQLLAKDAAKLMPDPTRRLFLRGGMSVGALAFLTGCDIVDEESAEHALMKVSYFNDRVQAWLFNPNKLAPTYPENAITRPFPFNAYYPEEEAPEVDGDDYALEVGGIVENTKSWTGVRFSEFLRRIGADTRAKFVWFRCAEGYSTSIDMATALHPQTQMTFKFDGEILPVKYGFPMKIRIPTKLGFKNPKYVMEMAVINNWNPGYWEEQGYNWFSGI